MEHYRLITEDIGVLLSNRLVQLVLALTWARFFFPDWVEAVGSEVVLKLLGGI